MKAEDIHFENFEMSIQLEGIERSVSLVMLDDLFASEEELSALYKGKISRFLNTIDDWYNKVVESMISNVTSETTITASSLRLLRIYILFEQNEEELYGLNFGADFDPEHGCGVKIKGANYQIVEVGHAEVAFYL